MRDYELVMVVNPDGGDEGFSTAVERVSQFIRDNGGELIKVDAWGRRKLAYPINRNIEGFYAVIHFSFDPRDVRVLEDNLARAEDLLRHLIVKMEEVKVAAQKETGDGGA